MPEKYGMEPVAAVEKFWPVPPYWVPMAVACQMPEVIVPKVVVAREVVPETFRVPPNMALPEP